MRRMYSEKQIDSQIKGVIESGQVDNAKPLYFHPVLFYTTAEGVVVGGKTLKFFASCTILNNEETSLAGTFKKIYDYATSKFNRLNVDLNIYNSTDNKMMFISQILIGDNHMYCIGYDSTGTRITENTNQLDLYAVRESITTLDGVNKIN